MNDKLTKDNIIQNVLEKIQNNELSVTPKAYFTIKLVGVILLLLLIGIIGVFLSSFIFFSMEVGDHTSLMGFGPTGFQVFLKLFPWYLFIIEICLICLLEYFLRSFKFGYKIPILYLLLGLIVVMCIGGALINLTSIHPRLLKNSNQNRLPSPIDRLYKNAQKPLPLGSGILRGVVSEVRGDEVVVEIDDTKGAIYSSSTIIFSKEAINKKFKIGDSVFIRGEIKNGSFEVVDIKVRKSRILSK